ncbi:FKBP-type peptidyl-prolyl cis-trans isomerase [Hyphobacterium sp. CCMP332]|nr:FKBP-type peptidyl-prolyl cis-trans isomerase [Hyphobacterium sp. CCMP332]
MLKITSKILFVLIVLSGFGCDNLANGGGKDKFTVTEKGLEYKLLNDAEGPVANIGDMLTFNMVLYKNEDSVITSTWETGNPIKTPLQEPGFNGDVSEGFALMSVGDSAFFKVPIDSLFKGRMNNMPPFLQGAKYLSYTIKMENIQTQEEVQAEKEAAQAEQKQTDDNLIQDYLSANGIEAEKTESGIYYTITDEGDGTHPTIQNQVTVHYTGKLLNGNVFDSSIPENMPERQGMSGEPVTFPLSGVVRGWQEGIPLLSKGGSGVLYIPSYLAYGAQSPSPAIPANSVLIFEVELLDIK